MSTTIDCPTFIDLRTLAQEVPAAASGLEDPFGAGARRFDVRAGPCAVFAVAPAAGSGTCTSLDSDMWLLVEGGSVTLAGPAGDMVLNAGESCVIARATPFAWQASPGTTLIAMSYPGGEGGEPGIVEIDNDATLAPSNPPAAHLLLGETPACRSNNHFASRDQTFKCGIWDSTPYQRTPIFFHHTELMHLLAGSVSFTDAAGRSATFSKGDTFIIEQGAECSWDSQEVVAKIYAQFKPAA